jgi:hypothetical protein
MELAYEINTPAVSGEIIDGEAIVLHLKNGHYFSMEGSAALIWAGIERRLSSEHIAQALVARFAIDSGEAAKAVGQLIRDLLANDLVRPVGHSGENDAALGEVVPHNVAYAPPRLDVFTDMQDLLLLDPIHEVDEGGWPLAPRQAQA